MKKLIYFFLLILTLGCTENQRARTFGGNEEIKLSPNEKLINITWKDVDLWILTEDTVTGVQYFRENSSFGLWEGQITIK